MQKINQLLNPDTKIRIAYQTFKSAMFFLNKDRLPDSLSSNITYKYTCDQCSGQCYIGETVRHLWTRANEHVTAKPCATEISMHEHAPSMSNFQIVARHHKTKIGEGLVYYATPTNFRMNNNKPAYTPKLFTTSTLNSPSLCH